MTNEELLLMLFHVVFRQGKTGEWWLRSAGRTTNDRRVLPSTYRIPSSDSYSEDFRQWLMLQNQGYIKLDAAGAIALTTRGQYVMVHYFLFNNRPFHRGDFYIKLTEKVVMHQDIALTELFR